MKFLKRATPWMITLVILFGAYVASYFWFYKPKKGIKWGLLPPITIKDKLLDQFYRPMVRWDEERIKQNTLKELLRQCQGEWVGLVLPRSHNVLKSNQPIRVRVIIESDQFKIIEAESMPELMSVIWKIGFVYDYNNPYGIWSSADNPQHSSIYLRYDLLDNGIELLTEVSILGDEIFYGRSAYEQGFMRPAAPPTPSN
jgi:hypothetical protein